MIEALDKAISWPHTLFDRVVGSADLLPVPFVQFDQRIHWEASVWLDDETGGYGVTFWEPEMAARLPEHISDLPLDEAVAAATNFAREGGIQIS